MENILLNVNGQNVSVNIEPKWTLLYVLREVLDLTGAKQGCGTGDCGACRVIIDGEAVNSCVVRAMNAVGKRIETIEGISDSVKLHPLQQAFIDCGAVQCGFCTPGMILSAKALLDLTLEPTEKQIREAIDPNLCRCTGYVKIIDAVFEAAKRMREAKT